MTEAEYPMKNYGDPGGCISVEAARIMRIGQWALLVSERPLNNIRLTSRHLTSRCNQGAFFLSRNSTLGGRNRSFLDGVSVPLEFLDSLYCVHFNDSYGVGSNEPLCLLNLDAGIKVFLSHSLMWICKTKIRISFINQGQVNKGALYASLLLTSLHLGHLNNETLSITQGNSQSIVTTYKGTKQLLSGLWIMEKSSKILSAGKDGWNLGYCITTTQLQRLIYRK